MRKVIYFFLLVCITAFGNNRVTINYKENEPLLGNDHYLTFAQTSLGTYEDTIGYFSTIEIIGKNLELKNNLKKIVIKYNGEILKNEKIEWKHESFELKNLKLNGVTISLKWYNLQKDQIGLMLNEWSLEEQNHEIEIEYHYNNNKIEKMTLDINLPKFNPEIYLDIDLDAPIIKRQEYGKKIIILKKIKLKEYDLEITKNSSLKSGLKVKVNSKLSIGNNEYLGVVRVFPLIEKYPNIYIENVNPDNIFENSKEIDIGLELPNDLNYNDNYKIFGNLLEIHYGAFKKEVLGKVVIADGQKEIKRVFGLEKNDEVQVKICLNNDYGKHYKILEKNGQMLNNYKSLKLNINNEEKIIDSEGNSSDIAISIGKIKVENGKISILIEDKKALTQGEEVKFSILTGKDEILEHVNIQIFLEN